MNMIETGITFQADRRYGPRPCFFREQARLAKQKTYRTNKPCFYGHNSLRYTVSGECIECIKAYHATDEYKLLRKRYRYYKPYGITFQQYEATLMEQKFCCAACGDELDLAKNTHQDHIGNPPKARGILCHWCNLAIGNLKDSIERAEKVAAYLKKWSSRL